MLYLYALLALITPNVVLVITEGMPLWASLANIALPLGAYMLLLTIKRRTGMMIWWMFGVLFLGAFQIVLSYLFHKSIIAVDMFLNLLTTNSGEAGEVLQRIWLSVAVVIVLYVPLLVFATCKFKQKDSVKTVFRHRLTGCAVASLGILFFVFSLCFDNPPMRVTRHLFPVNVCYNCGVAIERTLKLSSYESDVSAFRFQTIDSRKEDDPEICVLVIGETARYDYQTGTRNDIRGISFPSKDGTVAYDLAFTQSNTTHKSVPMLLSRADAGNYSRLFKERGIFSVYKEAGYQTAFISNQKRNHSYIDLLAKEADTAVYINDLNPKDGYFTDQELIPHVKRILQKKPKRLFLVLHCYGNHYKYEERYTKKYAVYPTENTSDSLSLVNAYKNATLCFDRFLCSLTDVLSTEKASTALVYTSDHGENLQDDARKIFLHAAPVPTYYDLHVPLFLWFSKEYRAKYGALVKRVKSNAQKVVMTSETVFPSLIDLSGLKCRYLEESKSIVSPRYVNPREMLYLDDLNEKKTWQEMNMDEQDLRLLPLKR